MSLGDNLRYNQELISERRGSSGHDPDGDGCLFIIFALIIIGILVALITK